MAISLKRCPREGLRVQFNPNPVSMAMYSVNHRAQLPRRGAIGTVVTVSVPGGRKTCMRGPGGGLIYVKWGEGHIVGVAEFDLEVARGELNGARRRRRRDR